MSVPNYISEYVYRSNYCLTIADPTKPDAPLVLANNAFLDMVGYAADEVVGRNCRFLQGDKDQPDARRDISQSIKDVKVSQTLLRNFRKDGTPFDNLLFLYPICDYKNTPIYLMGSQFDVTGEEDDVGAQRHLDRLEAGIADIMRQSRDMRINSRLQISSAISMVLKSKILNSRAIGT